MIGCYLANAFKEEGRSKYHNVSQFYPKYSFKETDSQFSNCLNSKQYNFNSKQILDIARKYGID